MRDSSSSSYRPDIDGLRAVAVAAVVAYHAFPEWLPQGYIGVDLFFVISGYLISGIIFSELARGTFSFAEFYRRRIRRIVPALAIVVAATLGFGAMCLLPDEFRQLGRHALGGATFSSNLILLGESGYFDIEAWRKPLLHLWSLGVEEQYYLLWPLCLYAARGRGRTTRWLIIGLGLSSFALNLLLTTRNPAAAFYLPLTRFWELMIGSGLAHWQRRTSAVTVSSGAAPAAAGLRLAADACSLLALIALGTALFDVDPGRPFPGWWAVLPCAAAALFIAAGPASWFNRVLLSNRAAVRIGLISYPIYLWHVPVFSFGRMIYGESLGPLPVPARLLLCGLAVALAWGTHLLVEQPIRRIAPAWQPHLMTATTMMLLVIGAAGVFAMRAQFRPRVDGDAAFDRFYEARRDFQAVTNRTIPGHGGTVLLFGDSHMEQYWPRIEALIRAGRGRMKSIEFHAQPSCAPVPGIERESTECLDFVRRMFARASQHDIDTVVIAASWVGFAERGDYYRADDAGHEHLDILDPRSQWVFDTFTRALSELQQQKKKRVIVLLSSPRGEALAPWAMVDRHAVVPRLRPPAGLSRHLVNAMLGPIDSKIAVAVWRAGAEVLDPTDWFCSWTACPAPEIAGEPLLMDSSHLRASIVRDRASALDQFLVAP